MLVIKIKDGEAIDRPLKEYKRKISRTRLSRMVKANRYYIKPTAKRRLKRMKAVRTMDYIRDHLS